MKRIFFTILFGLIGIVASAQEIYSKIEYFDKFDDVIKTEIKKTLVTIDESDSIITVETKGKQIERYIIIDIGENGTKEKIENLVANVFGYEKCYYCVNEKYFTHWQNENKRKASDLILSHDSSLDVNEIIESDSIGYYMSLNDMLDFRYFSIIENRYAQKIIKRYVSLLESSFYYKAELFWIWKNDGSRIIYTK